MYAKVTIRRQDTEDLSDTMVERIDSAILGHLRAICFLLGADTITANIAYDMEFEHSIIVIGRKE